MCNRNETRKWCLCPITDMPPGKNLAASQAAFLSNVRFWPLADMDSCTAHVRFRDNSGHRQVRSARVDKEAQASDCYLNSRIAVSAYSQIVHSKVRSSWRSAAAISARDNGVPQTGHGRRPTGGLSFMIGGCAITSSSFRPKEAGRHDTHRPAGKSTS